MISRLALSELSTIEEPLSLALGVFDGLHLGHRAVLAKAKERAQESGGLSGLLTFDPHPIQVLVPNRQPLRLLSSIAHKAAILDNLRLDVLVVVEFDRAMANQTANQFLAQLQQARGLYSLAAGSDWRFGKMRQGDSALLKGFGLENQVAVDTVDAVLDNGDRISSTRIRQALHDGNLAAAEEMLGRPYSVISPVEQGRRLGRTLGFPTANLVPSFQQLPPNGVWVVEARLAGQDWIYGVANLGTRPTVSEEEALTLEVHLLDWEGDLYGQDLEVRFRSFLRGEEKFANLEDLQRQISHDVAGARAYFEA